MICACTYIIFYGMFIKKKDYKIKLAKVASAKATIP